MLCLEGLELVVLLGHAILELLHAALQVNNLALQLLLLHLGRVQLLLENAVLLGHVLNLLIVHVEWIEIHARVRVCG